MDTEEKDEGESVVGSGALSMASRCIYLLRYTLVRI